MYFMFKNQLIIRSLFELSLNSSIGCQTLRTLTQFKPIKCLKATEKHKCLPNSRTLQTSCQMKSPVENYTPFETMDGIIYKVRRFFGYQTIPKYRLKYTSVYLYESCTDGIPIEKFFTHLALPDNYLSWFLVTQLHVWMLQVRAMSEGKEGRIMRNELVSRMWEDCDERLKKFATFPAKVRRKGMEDLLQQFQAAIFAYDEGHLTNDKVLAASVWRTLFMYEDVDPRHLELVVSYVRTQIEHLQTIGTEKFILDGKITWKEFPPLYP